MNNLTYDLFDLLLEKMSLNELVKKLLKLNYTLDELKVIGVDNAWLDQDKQYDRGLLK
jgi:hypothetical protein